MCLKNLLTRNLIIQEICRRLNSWGLKIRWQSVLVMAAGIFINIAANASQEREDLGSKDITTYWRTIKKCGELNEKYPGGIEQQRMLLEMEGHEVITKGKRYFVKDYQNEVYQLK